MESAIARWKETVDLSFELTDTMFVLLYTLMDYCKKQNIPLYQETGMWNLVNRAQGIIKQIEVISSTTLPKLADEKKHLFRTDEDVPVPVGALYKGAIDFFVQKDTFVSTCLRKAAGFRGQIR